MLVVNNIFSGKLVPALCWMLVHSLWMGLALAVVTGAIILTTKKHTAALRYSLLSGALLVFIMAVVAVFIQQLAGVEMPAPGLATNITVNSTSSTNIFTGDENNGSYIAGVAGFFNNNATIIVGCWLLMILFRCIRFAGGLHKIKQLKTTQLTPVNDHWNQRLQQLSAALQIKSKIQLVQSGIATIPMVVGHFKPMILFPLGLLTSLPAEEVEAVLLHELAHIRRKDYAVNLLQHFAEILFFFNPAVLWVSALIKTERENCCDDIAVAKAGSKRNYINALVSFQEYHLDAPQYVTALSHHNKHLLQRVKRILYNNNKTLNAMEKTFLTLCLAAATSLAVLFTQTSAAQTNDTTGTTTKRDTISSIANRHFNPADFTEGSSTGISENINGIEHTLYIFKRKGVLYEIYDDMESFKINGKTIPQSDWGKYNTIISQLKNDYQNCQTSINDKKNIQEKLKAEQLALLAQKDKLNAEMQQLGNNDNLKAEELELQAQKEKLDANMQQLNNHNKLKAEQLELLAQQKKLTAEMQQLQSTDKLNAEQQELLAQKNRLNAKIQQLNNADKLKAEQLQLKAEQEKINREQQQLLINADKLSAEQLQMQADQNKLKAEELAKAAAEQKLRAEIDSKGKNLILPEKRQVEINKQKAKAVRKDKKAERKEEKADVKEAREEQQQARKDKVQQEKDNQQQAREDAEKENQDND